jgi:ribosomal-protein-alanine N-acetyltransferase
MLKNNKILYGEIEESALKTNPQKQILRNGFSETYLGNNFVNGSMNRLPKPLIQTPRLRIKLLEPDKKDLMVQFRIANRDYLKPWEPVRSVEFYSTRFWDRHLNQLIRDFKSGSSLCLAIMDLQESEVLGVCNFTNTVFGTFQSCHLGYALGKGHQGEGYMTEALTAAIDYVFTQINLHRIMANYMPHNHRSANLLERLGFRIEGQAESFLLIDGKWEDHVLTSLINPNH